MSERDSAPDRRALLAFVERHWRELTLREAMSLRAEFVLEALVPNPPSLKIS